MRQHQIFYTIDGSFCRVWKDGKWVDKEDYMEIGTKED